MRRTVDETNRANPLLPTLLVVLSLVLTTVYYREGGSGPLHVARRVVLAVAAPAARAGTAITSPMRAVGRVYDSVTTDKSDLERLRRQNAELKNRVAALEEARQENERMRKLVSLAATQEYGTVGARIVGRPTSSWEGALMIDQGSDSGIAAGMPVIAAEGLLGQVMDVTAKTSRVRLITDQRSGVASQVQRTRVGGLTKGSVEGVLWLDFVDRALLPKRGDVVLTSGMGGVYPKGIVVGDVTDVADQPGWLNPRITVKSRIRVNEVEEVLVLITSGGAVKGVSDE